MHFLFCEKLTQIPWINLVTQRSWRNLQNSRRSDPFLKEFFEIFLTIYKQKRSMLKKLQIKKNKIEKKLKSIQMWKKISSMILVATFAAILIFPVRTAAVAAPSAVAALVAASAIPMDAIGKWIDSLWKNYENALKGQRIRGASEDYKASRYV